MPISKGKIRGRCNLKRDGIARAAVHVAGVIRSAGGRSSVVVRPSGNVRLYAGNQLPSQEEINLVGRYNSATPLEQIADDLACRLEEIA